LRLSCWPLVIALCVACASPRQELPDASIREPAAITPPSRVEGPLVVVLSARELRIRDRLVAKVPPREAWAQGFPAELKRRGPNDLYLMPLARELETASGVERASVEVAPEIPYRMLMEVLFTLGQHGVSEYELRIEPGRSLRVTPPSTTTPTQERLHLVAMIVTDGIALKTSAGNIAPGCEQLDRGIAVPRQSDRTHDLSELRRCARELKNANPNYAHETDVVITANPPTPIAEVADVALALARDEQGTLFDDVHFGVSR
jgi:hypothetical protein